LLELKLGKKEQKKEQKKELVKKGTLS
jgi:hypothetical protein